jgi:hypothetical protein
VTLLGITPVDVVVVGFPVFLFLVLGCRFSEVSVFLAVWVIVYGIIQFSAPILLQGHHPDGVTTRWQHCCLYTCREKIASHLLFE